MKTVTQDEYDSSTRHGYAEVRQGVPYMLYLEADTGTVWGPVRIVDPPIRDHDSGTTYEPWTNGWSVGYRVTFANGRVEFFYMNPSGGSDDGVPNVFVYQGADGDPAADPAICHFDLTVPVPS